MIRTSPPEVHDIPAGLHSRTLMRVDIGLMSRCNQPVSASMVRESSGTSDVDSDDRMPKLIARRRESSRHRDPFYERRRRFEATLRVLGLADAFAAMPRRVQEVFWRFKLPDPTLVFDESIPATSASGDIRTLRKTLEASFRAASIDVNGSKMLVRDFVAIVVGCMQFVQHVQAMPRHTPEVKAFLDVARPVLERCHEEHAQASMQSMYTAMRAPLLAEARHDGRWYASKLDVQFDPVSGKAITRVIVSAAKPETRDVTINGERRPMYRVAASSGVVALQWLSWDLKTIRAQLPDANARRPDPEEQIDLPVFVQSHALRQLHSRVNFPPAAPYLEAWLTESLAEPRIVERLRRSDDGENLLVEFRLLDYRLGYFVATVMRDLVAVRTFLFLTMEGTPEARLLRRRMRLTRRDVDWLSLADLTTFTETDLCDDPVLRPLFDNCGCGHLFDLANDQAVDFAPVSKPVAAEMKRYLRMAA